MSERGAYGDRLGRAFRLPKAPVLESRSLQGTPLAVTEIRFDAENFGWTDPIPREDAYLVALQIRDCPRHGLRVEGRDVPCSPIRSGMTMLYDLRRDPVAHIQSPFHSLHFYLPRRALNEVCDELEIKRVGELRFEHGRCIRDPIVNHLLSALLPVLSQSDESLPLFTDHLAMALRVHVVRHYGDAPRRREAPSGGLMPWQLRRVEELTEVGLTGEFSLARLARECGLSTSHFARAFRQSTGLSPHQWLLERRVDAARQLLRSTSRSLAEIALECGFADQSHFTRVFTRIAGISPGRMRRRDRSMT